MKLKLTIFTLALGFLATGASAATLNFDSIDWVTDSSGNYVGPYDGRLDGKAYKLFCDDFNHHVNLGDTYQVNVSTIDNLSQTRFGGLTGAASLYQQIFFLSSYLMNATNTDRGNIQDAIWGYFSNSAPNQSDAAVQGWKTLAQNNYLGKDYSNFRILTDSGNQLNGKQELFITTTPIPPGLTSAPEPGTWMMLIAGVGIIGLVRLRGRK